MAYGVKYYVTHKDDINGNSVTWRIEILENGYGGGTTELRGTGKIFSFGYDGADIKKIWDNPVQKGTLELVLNITDSSDETVLTDIVGGDEKEYQLRLKKDGSIKWTGFVIPDLLDWPVGPYPFGATITAKDLHLLESEDHALNTAISYNLYSTGLADLLNSGGLSLGLYIYDEWTTSQLTATDDFFEQAYYDEFQLQDFSAYSEGNFEPISKLQALKELLPPGFVVRQWDDKWQLFDLAHLAQNPTAATRYEYSSGGGARTGKTTSLDLTDSVDRSDSFMLRTSRNKPYPGLKRLSLDFNHKTSIQNLLFDSEYIHTDVNDRSTAEIKVPNTSTRRFMLSGQVEVTTDTNPGMSRPGDAKIIVQVGDYEQDISDGSWGLNTGEQTVNVFGSDDTLTGTFTFPADSNIPSAIGEDTLTVELRWATVSGETVTQVKWYNLSAELVNGGSVDNAATNHMRLEQGGNYSVNAEVGTTIFGQGPDSLSNSAIRYLDLGTYKLLTSFKHVGGTAYQYEEFVLKNIMNLQRQITYNIRGDLWALFEPDNILAYDSKNYFMLNGQLEGAGSQWDGEFVQLSWNTGSDTFTEYFKIKDNDAGTSIPPSSGAPGQTTGDYDGRYLRRDGGNTVTQYIDLEEISAPSDPASNVSRLYAMDEAGFTVLHYDDSNGLDLEIGRDGVFPVRNNSGGVLSKGEAVYVTGSNGNFPTVDKADASDASKMPILGLVAADISDSSFGQVIVDGDLRSVDASSFSQGDKLYVSASTPGALTATKPTGDNIPQIVGTVIKNTAGGIIEVRQGTLFDFSQPGLNAEFNNLSAVAGTFTGLLQVKNNDAFFGDIDSGSYIDIGNLGGPNAWVDARGAAADVTLELRAKGSGVIRARSNMAFLGTGTFSGLLTAEAGIDIVDQSLSGDNASMNFAGGHSQWIPDAVGTDFRFVNSAGSSDVLRVFESGGISINASGLSGYTALYANGTVGINDTLTVSGDIDPGATFTYNIGSATNYWLTGYIAELYVPKLVVEEHLSTTGGVHYTGIGTVLTADVGSGATSIPVQNNNLSNGDYVRLYARGQFEIMKITSAASGSGPYTYSVSRDVDGSGANNWNAGDGVFSTGGAAGFGFIEQYATNSLTTGVSTSGPTIAYWVRTGTSSGDLEVREVVGNIDGFYGVSGDEFGLGAGDYDGGNGNFLLLTDQQANLQIDTFLLNAGSGNLKLDSTNGVISLSDDTFGNTGIQLDYNSGTPRAFIGTNAGNFFKWDGTDIFIEGVGTSIDNSGFSFGGGILTGDGSGVAVEGIMTVGSNLFLGDNVTSQDSGSNILLIGDWDGSGTDPRIKFRGSSNSVFRVDQFGVRGFDSGANQVFKVDLSGSDEHQLGGAYFDDVDLWLGNKTKGSATLLLDGTNGKIVTEAIGTLVIGVEREAGFTSNAAADAIDDDYYLETTSRSANGANSQRDTKITRSFIKRFGADTIIVRGVGKQGGADGGGGAVVSRTSEVFLKATNLNPSKTQSASNSATIASASDVQFSFEVDISGLDDGDVIKVELDLKSSIDISSYDSGTYTTTTEVLEAVTAQTAP